MIEEKTALLHFKKTDPVIYAFAKKYEGRLTQRVSVKKTQLQLFTALCTIVISQQLSTKAADSIYKKVLKTCGTITPKMIESTSLQELKVAGLSASKIKTLMGLAREVLYKNLILTKLSKNTQAEIMERLTALWGVGPWTVEMFLLFSLGFPDLFSTRDLGLRRSIEFMYSLPKDAPVEMLESISQRWSPHRSYACLVLWAAYDAQYKK
jgi:DNA-3-methyladenine glycosylase II